MPIIFKNANFVYYFYIQWEGAFNARVKMELCRNDPFAIGDKGVTKITPAIKLKNSVLYVRFYR